jgi:signal transduction histidine kinase
VLTNAIKYTPAGDEIVARSKPRGNRAIVSVHDSGIGRDPAILSRMFDLFGRVTGRRGRTRGVARCAESSGALLVAALHATRGVAGAPVADAAEYACLQNET